MSGAAHHPKNQATEKAELFDVKSEQTGLLGDDSAVDTEPRQLGTFTRMEEANAAAKAAVAGRKSFAAVEVSTSRDGLAQVTGERPDGYEEETWVEKRELSGPSEAQARPIG